MRVDFQNFLVKSDTVCDYIPFISTVNNVVDIFQKIVVTPFLNKSHLSSNSYYAHLAAKSWTRCFVSLIPVVGNIFIVISDLFRTREVPLPKLDDKPKIDLEKERRNLIAKLPKKWDAFKTAPEYLRSDREAALAAIQEDTDNLAFVSRKLWSNKDFVLAAIEKTHFAIFLVEKDIQNDPDIFSHFFTHHSVDDLNEDWAIVGRFEDEAEWTNRLKQIRGQLIKLRGAENMDTLIKDLSRLHNQHLRKHSILAVFIPEKFLEDKTFINQVTVDIEQLFFKFARGHIEEDQETINNLLKFRSYALQFLPTRLLKDRKFMVDLLAMHPHIYSDPRFKFKLKDNEQFFLDVIKRNPGVLSDENFAKDITVSFAIRVVNEGDARAKVLRWSSLPASIKTNEKFVEATGIKFSGFQLRPTRT